MYGVTFLATASTFVEVEADTEEEAVEKASEELPGSLCHQCSRAREIGDFEVDTVEYQDPTSGEWVSTEGAS